MVHHPSITTSRFQALRNVLWTSLYGPTSSIRRTAPSRQRVDGERTQCGHRKSEVHDPQEKLVASVFAGTSTSGYEEG